MMKTTLPGKLRLWRTSLFYHPRVSSFRWKSPALMTFSTQPRRQPSHRWDAQHVSQYSTVGCWRTACRRTGWLEFLLRNDPRLEKWVKNGFTKRKQRLLWRRLLRRHCWLRNDSTSAVRNILAAFPAPHASSRTVCTLQADLHDSETDWKIRTRLAGVVKNKNDPGWDRLLPRSSAPDSTVLLQYTR